LTLQLQLVVLASAFVVDIGQYRLVSFLFAVVLLTVPLVPCGVGATACNLIFGVSYCA